MSTNLFQRRVTINPESRKCMIQWCVVVLSLLGAISLDAQKPDSTARKTFEVRGYLKDLQSLTFDRNFDNLITGNLIHNRINVRWNPGTKITGAIEFRNRLFWGEEVRSIPGFSKMIRNPNEAINLSALLINSESLVLQSTIDRFWLEYHTNKWDARVGRQRINWGIGTIWNPNDIFNTYNFLDFDYEERPGRDGVKVSYHLSEMSNVELAAAAADQSNKTVAAIKYFTNKWDYDLQFSAGVYHEKLTMGAGWSGRIKDAGFKGEVQYFAPRGDTTAQVNITLETDCVFEKGWYMNVGFLYNSNGVNKPVDNWNFVTFRLSPQSLMPTQWNSVITIGKEFTPLLSGNLSCIYAPGTNLMILLPSIKYNIASNVDIDFIWQSFFAEQFNQFEGISHRCFIRAKWNF